MKKDFIMHTAEELETMTKAELRKELAKYNLTMSTKAKKDAFIDALLDAEAEEAEKQIAEAEFADTCALQEISEECKEAETDSTEATAEETDNTAEAETAEESTEETETTAEETEEAESTIEELIRSRRKQKMTLKEMLEELAFIKEYNERIEFKVLKTNDVAVKLDNKRIFRYIASSQLFSTARLEYMSEVNDEVTIIKTATKVKARCKANRDNMIQILATADVFA